MLTDSDYETDLVFCFNRRRLYELFGLIEKEFEALYAENLTRKFNILFVCVHFYLRVFDDIFYSV